jgi:transcriptional regulator with XRE-family HTH domain
MWPADYHAGRWASKGVRSRPNTPGMRTKRTARPFSEGLPELLEQRGLSLRALARLVGVGDDHLSRVLRGARAKRATGELTRRVAVALELPEDYFPEARIAFIVEYLDKHPILRDRVYDQLHKKHKSTKPASRTSR